MLIGTEYVPAKALTAAEMLKKLSSRSLKGLSRTLMRARILRASELDSFFLRFMDVDDITFGNK